MKTIESYCCVRQKKTSQENKSQKSGAKREYAETNDADTHAVFIEQIAPQLSPKSNG